MNRFVTILAAAVVFAVAGCGGNESSQDGTSVSASSSSVPFDRAFIDAMVPHHESAIAMAREAKQAGLSQPELVTIADDIVATQQDEIDQMLAWREEWFGAGPRESEMDALAVLGLSSEEAGMMSHGGDLSTAADVDMSFAEIMIAHHEGAIKMAELASVRASHDEIRQLADAIIAAQAREIEIMKPHAEGAHH
ncbi:MAG: DUF305 domain-containing protein [Actinomycetota bacterium]